MSIAAYRTVMRESESPRQIEKRLFSKMISVLEPHSVPFDSASTPMERLPILASGLRDALNENLRFWTALKYDLLSPGNQLPPATRAGILSLALWVERMTASLLRGEPGLRDLIEVNRTLMSGLAGNPGA